MLHLRTDYQGIQDTTGETSIAAGEPVFLVRAKDKVAATVVRLWAAYALHAGTDSQTCARVQEWADEMQAYADEHYAGGKVPDVPSGALLASRQVALPMPTFCQHCGSRFELGHATDCPVLTLLSPSVYTLA